MSVEKPRELVADAEALLGLTRSLLASVKTQSIGGVTPAEFVSCLIREFGQHKTTKEDFAKSNTISWKSVGTCVSPAFMNGSGCMGMLGPMETELKPPKLVVRRKRPRAEMKARPAELDKDAGVIADTYRNMQVMFEILKKEKKAKVENLMLNRNSFAQTVENLFALSFLVKDGRVCIDVDEKGTQFAVPRNGPSAKDIKSGVAKNHHFIFRFDSSDWQCMKSCVAEGEELTAARAGDEKCRQVEVIARDSQAIPVKKLSRNCVAIPNGIPT